MYSTIIKKKCKCNDCTAKVNEGIPEKAKYPSWGCDGKNYNCLSDEEKAVIGSRNKLIQRKKAYDNTQKRMLHVAQREVNADAQRLVLWFKYQMTVSKKECENCFANLGHYCEGDWHGSQHHIVDKSPLNGCPSVAAHPQNHLVLGFWCCHSQWHTSFLNASKMPVFEEAKRKYQLFKDDIAEGELKKVNPYLKEENPYQAMTNQHQRSK